MGKKTEEIHYYNKKTSFVLNKRGFIFIPCKINGKELLVFYDSGHSGSLEEQISSDTLFPKRCKTLKTTMMTYSKKEVTIITGLQYYDIESDLFNHKQYVGELKYTPSDTIIPKCISKMTDNDEWGKFILTPIDLFPFNSVMLLNFSDTSIMLLDSNAIYDTTDFISVKSIFYGSKFKIYLTVDSVGYDFLFDTGSSLFLSLPSYEKHRKDNDIHIAGYYGRDYAGIVIDTVVEQQTNSIKINELDSIKGSIFYINGSTSPNAGINFIANFDWIIDRHREKVYTKKIKEPRAIEMKKYTVSVFDTLLQISLLPVSETEYQLFSIIDSVNGEKVNADNICQMRALLNKDDGLKNNHIVVLPPPEKEISLEIDKQKKIKKDKQKK